MVLVLQSTLTVPISGLMLTACAASGIIPHGEGGCLGDFLGLELKVAQSRELATVTTGGVGSPVTVAEDVGWAAVLQECTQLHPTSFELMRAHKIT
jgi:hypothetical protein